MASLPVTAANDDTPVDDEMVRRLCQMTPDEARQLAIRLPMEARVHLALFCNARAQLREGGSAITKIFTEEALHSGRAFAGAKLFAQATGIVDTSTYSSIRSLR